MQVIKYIQSVLFSSKTTLVALVLYAVSMAYATFLENDYGTPAVWAVIYDAWWFELIMLVLALNFLGNIVKYQLISRKKWSIFLFHIAFVVVLLGAAITRYTGYEGTMRIREGQSSDVLLSNQMYFQALTQQGEETYRKEKGLTLSSLTVPDFDINIASKESPVYVKCMSYTPDAEEALIAGNETVLSLVVADERGRRDVFLSAGESVDVAGIKVGFGTHLIDGLNLQWEADSLRLVSSDSTQYMVMSTQLAGSIAADTPFVVKKGALYNTRNVSLVFQEMHHNAQKVYRPTLDKDMALTLPDRMEVEIRAEGEIQHHVLHAQKGVMTKPSYVEIGANKIQLLFGPKVQELPFALALRDFQLERYPGSASPSSYASEVTIQDGEKEIPYRIFMNNVLDYKGYRFFQASYDTDELGTILSVNKDYWGTLITYIGYTLMGIGMFFALFGKATRFQLMNRRLETLKKKKMSLSIILLLMSQLVGATNTPANKIVDSLAAFTPVPTEYAADFGALLVQDMDGRIKPVNSLASELCRKLMRRTSFTLGEDGPRFDVNQLFLALHKNPQVWQFVPLVKIDKDKGQPVLALLEREGEEALAFRDFFDKEGTYHLIDMVEEANRKKPAERSAFDKEVLAVDERFNLLYQALGGNYLKIFPKKGDPDHKWYANTFQKAGFSKEDSLFVRGIMPEYYYSIQEAQQTGDWAKVEENMNYIRTYQEVIGEEVIPTKGRRDAEILYNKLKLFNHLFSLYWLIGLGLLILALARVFAYENKVLKGLYYLLAAITFFAFMAHTFNLGLRWYAGDYPPWSNGYEMTILVSWCLVLFGFVFMRKTDFILPLAVLFSGTLMFVAFLDWLNPEITNLVPVLKSYWLKIHVAVIVASYAPLGLCALLGLTSLSLIIANGKQDARMSIAIKELTALNEMSMTIGLYLLALGTFLGGVWANESWGRYWAWDPKETWALISIIVYAVVLHLRLVPALKGDYIFGVSSVVAFFSIIMTSFGVNYYLSGLHSYAQGDPMPIPTFMYVIVAIVLIVSLLAYWKNKKTEKYN